MKFNLTQMKFNLAQIKFNLAQVKFKLTQICLFSQNGNLTAFAFRLHSIAHQ